MNLSDEESCEIVALLKRLSGDAQVINALTAIGRSPLRGVLLPMRNFRVGLWRAKTAILRRLLILPRMIGFAQEGNS